MGLPYIPQYCTFDDLPDYAKMSRATLQRVVKEDNTSEMPCDLILVLKRVIMQGHALLHNRDVRLVRLMLLPTTNVVTPWCENALEKLLDIVELREHRERVSEMAARLPTEYFDEPMYLFLV